MLTITAFWLFGLALVTLTTRKSVRLDPPRVMCSDCRYDMGSLADELPCPECASSTRTTLHTARSIDRPLVREIVLTSVVTLAVTSIICIPVARLAYRQQEGLRSLSPAHVQERIEQSLSTWTGVFLPTSALWATIAVIPVVYLVTLSRRIRWIVLIYAVALLLSIFGVVRGPT